MDIEKDSNREAFESWFESRYDAHFMQFALDLDMYVDKHTQTSWEAWQAAKAQAVPEGFVLVSVDTLEECLDWAHIAKWDSPSNEVDKKIAHHEALIESAISAQEQTND